jgi:uncharacterized membrane protein YfcA
VLLSFAPSFQIPQPPKLELDTVAGKGWAIAIGAVLGCIVGMTSVASGSLFALVLITFFRLDARQLVGTDLAQAAILLGWIYFIRSSQLRYGRLELSLTNLARFGSRSFNRCQTLSNSTPTLVTLCRLSALSGS